MSDNILPQPIVLQSPSSNFTSSLEDDFPTLKDPQSSVHQPQNNPQPPEVPLFSPLGGAVSDASPIEYVTNNRLGFARPVDLASQTNSLTGSNIFPESTQKISHSPNPLFFFGLISFFIILIILATISTYAIAYGYIDIGNPQITEAITGFVQRLPFTPR